MISSLTSIAALAETAVHPTVVLQYVLGGVLIFLSVVLTIVILFQSAKDKRLSGAIAGGTESFFGSKAKAKTADRILSKITIVVSILVVLVTLALVIILNCVPRA